MTGGPHTQRLTTQATLRHRTHRHEDRTGACACSRGATAPRQRQGQAVPRWLFLRLHTAPTPYRTGTAGSGTWARSCGIILGAGPGPRTPLAVRPGGRDRRALAFITGPLPRPRLRRVWRVTCPLARMRVHFSSDRVRGPRGPSPVWASTAVGCDSYLCHPNRNRNRSNDRF
jgi:hypothetical protein